MTTTLSYTSMLGILLLLCTFASSNQIVYLNTSLCDNTANVSCFAPNDFSYYFALNLLVTEEKSVPSFSLDQDDIIEILWTMPIESCLYAGISPYVFALSDGTVVFADIGNSLDVVLMSKQCNFPSADYVWGQTIRFLLSPNAKVQKQANDGICTIVIPIPGPPYTNLTANNCHRPNSTSSPTLFSLLMRFTQPTNVTTFEKYVSNIDLYTKVKLTVMNQECHPEVFGYPSYFNRPVLTTETLHADTVNQFRMLSNNVFDTLFQVYPTMEIHALAKTQPFLESINYTYEHGFACINSSGNCQGACTSSIYETSRIFLTTENSHFLAFGCGRALCCFLC